jgi:spore germination protein
MAGVQVQSLYELNSIVDNLDANLAKARATSSSADSVRVLSDIATQSEMAEVILERMPVDITLTEEMSTFINKMGDSAKSMLYTVAANGELTPSQQKSLQYMYEANLAIKRELNQIVAQTKGADMLAALRGKGGILTDGFTNIQNNVIETPKGIQDGPFADSKENIGENALKGLTEITAPQAEELAKEYFADYKITTVDCRGEAVANSITVYNVELKTDDGDMLAQISKAGGKLVMFDSYKDCNDKNFSEERCEQIAADFLETLGYTDLKVVWSSENGTTCNLNFAPVVGGVVLYPDLIKVKVCEMRGLVTGLEAISYCLNHTERSIEKATISQDAAQSVINGNIEVKNVRKALIPFDGKEVLTYEFYGELDGGEYYIYVDATTGEEIEVLTVISTSQGRSLM